MSLSLVTDYNIANTTFVVSQDRYTGDNLHLRHLNHYHHNPARNASSARNPAGLERCRFKDFIRVLPQVLETLHGWCWANGSSVISWNSIDRSRTLFTKLYLCLLFERKWSRLLDLIYWRRRVWVLRERWSPREILHLVVQQKLEYRSCYLSLCIMEPISNL